MTSVKFDILVHPFSNKKKYLVVSSANNPVILANYKSLKIRFIYNNNDISDSFEFFRYFVVAGGCQKTIGYYKSGMSILPCEDVPFNLLLYHKLEFIFEADTIPDSIDIKNIQIIFDIVKSTKPFSLTYGANVDKWIDDMCSENKNMNALKFISGMCGLRFIGHIESIIPDLIERHEIVKIGDMSVHLVDSKYYQLDNVYFQIQNIAIVALVSIPNTEILFERCYYKFSTDTQNYRFPQYFLDYCGDALTSLVLYSYNVDEMKPCITLGDIKIVDKTIEITDDYIKYNFNGLTNEVWFNVLNKNIYINKYESNIEISELISGTYMLEFTKIYCQKDIRKKMAQFSQLDGNVVKLVKNQSGITDIIVNPSNNII